MTSPRYGYVWVLDDPYGRGKTSGAWEPDPNTYEEEFPRRRPPSDRKIPVERP